MGNPANVVFLVLDSLRYDRIRSGDTTLMPKTRQFFDNSISFEHSIATGSWTVPSHGSMFTGEYPSNHGATAGHTYLENGDKETIAESLQSQGYHTKCITTNPWITREFGFGRGFDSVDHLRDPLPFPDIPDPRDGVSASGSFISKAAELSQWCMSGNPLMRAAKAIYVRFLHEQSFSRASDVVDKILSEIEEEDEQFIFVNLMDMHEPYFEDKKQEKVSWNVSSIGNPPELSKSEIINAYDDAAKILDTELGRLFDCLRDKRVYRDSLIVVVGDHGQALGECGYWGHGTYLHDCLIHVPLAIKPPQYEGGKQINNILSLRKIPEILEDLVQTDRPVTGEELLHYTEDIVVSESAGPHTNSDYPTDLVSREGYRAYVSRGWSVLENRDTGELKISSDDEKSSTDRIKRKIREIKSKYRLNSNSLDYDAEVTNDKKRQLQELGYL